jgi:hypothetical protein
VPRHRFSIGAFLDTIRFEVIYTLREYLSIVRERTAIELEQVARKKGKSQGRLSRACTSALLAVFVTLFAAPMFWVKKRAMPLCSFHIDSELMIRTTKAGELKVPWSSVTQVHRLAEAYVVEMKGGAMPLPYRVFSLGSRAQFDGYIRAWQERSAVTPDITS